MTQDNEYSKKEEKKFCGKKMNSEQYCEPLAFFWLPSASSNLLILLHVSSAVCGDPLAAPSSSENCGAAGVAVAKFLVDENAATPDAGITMVNAA
jgi:hypothetical protein